MFSAERFKNKHLLAMRSTLNEIVGRGKFPLLYVAQGWVVHAKIEQGQRGWGEALLLALDNWPDQIVLHNVTRPGDKVKMAIEVLSYLEPPKRR